MYDDVQQPQIKIDKTILPNVPDSLMVTQIQNYLDHLRYERNFADTTVVGRAKMLYLFAKFAQQEPLGTLLIQRFLRDLSQNRKWTIISVRDALRDIRCFCKYLYFQGKEKEDFAYRIPTPKKPERLPKVIPADEVEKLFSQPCPVKTAGRIWFTYNMYFELLAKTGLRKTESKLLCRKDFNFEAGTINVRYSKGRRETYCLIPPDMTDRLKVWFEDRELAPDDLAFIGRDGRVLNNEGIRFALQARAKRAGVVRRVFPHLLRHFFATDLVRNNVDVHRVQRLMRHKSISSTQIYLNLVVEDLKEDLCKHSLIAKHQPVKDKKEKDPKQTIINIYNPNFVNGFGKWYQDYFKEGGIVHEYPSGEVPKPQLGDNGGGHLPSQQ